MKSWNKVAIIGVGLIGGSIGAAMLRRGLANRVVGVGRNSDSLRIAQQRGAVTDVTVDLNDGVAGAELVIVCTPVDLVADIVQLAARACPPGALITDAGSTKSQIVRGIELAQDEHPWPAGVRFVGSHPLAGNEKKGPQYANADLFSSRLAIITPTNRTDPEDRRLLREFWSGLGSSVVEMSPDEHDRVIAQTSHLPHLVASAVAAATPKQYVTVTAGGWLDTTRIAAGDPQLWRQILLSNRDNVLDALRAFDRQLVSLREALQKQDAEMLEQLLAQAKAIRDVVGS